jgi:dienelactone hydrolase
LKVARKKEYTMASDMVTVKADDGKSFQCFVAHASQTPAPVIVIIQEIFGHVF